MKHCILCGETLIKGENCHLNLDVVCIECENEVDEIIEFRSNKKGGTD